MKQIKKNWGKVHKGTKIYVKEDYKFRGIDKTNRTLKKGFYYICGFWCDAMGLSYTKGGFNDILVPSKALMYFYR